jgi:glyoxylase-like metal-dependent hydrolase (beta-lactamase superfamily II)
MADYTIDLRHVGRDRYVASQLLNTDNGPVIIDCGPGSTLENLKEGLAAHGLRVSDLHAVLLTHIHFDHAGAVGLLVAEHPALNVYVHERGAPHLIEPSKLVASATQIFGDRMDYLWGRILPTPAHNIRVLRGGEAISLGNRTLEVTYTPGHASHHVLFFERAEGTAYVGDVGGIRTPLLPYPLPVTPAPDFNLEQWLASIDAIAALTPRRLFSTHFGFSDDPVTHLDQLRHGLHDWTSTARRLVDAPGTDSTRASEFEQFVVASLNGKGSSDAIATMATFSDFKASFFGIARYLRKKVESALGA